MAYVTVNKHNEALRRIAELEAKLASCMSALDEISRWVDQPWRSVAADALAKVAPDDPLDDFNYVGSRHHY